MVGTPLDCHIRYSDGEPIGAYGGGTKVPAQTKQLQKQNNRLIY